MSRLSDTEAIVKEGIKGRPQLSESLNVDVRSIDNGYIRRESKYGDDGYSCKETYHQEKPDVDGLKPEIKKGNILSSATEYLNRK